jgi:hypothetical protein
MSAHRLEFDSGEQRQFAFEIDGDRLTLAGADGTWQLRPLDVKQVRVVIHLFTERAVLVGDDGEPQNLSVDEELAIAGGRLRLRIADPSEIVAVTSPRLKKRLLAIAGPEDGRGYLLPETGVVAIGKDAKQADIILRGMDVERLHCTLKIDGPRIEVVDEGSLNTQVNGKRVSRQELKAGDVLRIGPHQLRLEMVGWDEDFPTPGIPKRTPLLEDADDEGDKLRPLPPLPASASEAAKNLYSWLEQMPDLTGESLGHYHLHECLGRGFAGVVFRATHDSTGQEVAFKILAPPFPNGNTELQRFTTVIKSLLPLRHPKIVPILAAGKNAPYTWLVREYVKGESLARAVRRQVLDHDLDPAFATRVAVDLAEALDFARQHRIRHGAITPATILLSSDDQTARLADFGLLAALEGSQLANAMMEIRTPNEVAYLAPEQVTPGAFVDESADLYALGAVLFTMLTGKPPFVAGTTAEVLDEILSGGRPPRPSALNEDVDQPLERIVQKLLARQPEDRYQSPAELLEELRPVMAEWNEGE